MSEQSALDRGRSAAADRNWQAAFEHLARADAEHGLGPEDLERLAKASWWTGRSNASIEARERAYAAYVERGETERGAATTEGVQAYPVSEPTPVELKGIAEPVRVVRIGWR